MKRSEYRKPTKEDYIKMIGESIERCGPEYNHYTVTGHFGKRNGEATSLEKYLKRWESYEKGLRYVFGVISREFTGIRKWGISSREREMKVFLIPEIQGDLHFHGILSIPMKDSPIGHLKLEGIGKMAWAKMFDNQSFHIQPLEDNGWNGYSVKKLGHGDLIEDKYMVLPLVR